MTALGILALIAVIVVSVVLWQQRDGARPVSESSREATVAGSTAAQGGTADEGPTSVTQSSDAAGTVEAAPERGTASGDVIPAAVIDTAFHTDRVDAGRRFAGPVTVRGEMVSVNQSGDTPRIGMAERTRFNMMIVNVDPDQRLLVQNLSRGQTVTVSYREASSMGGSTILRSCRY